MVHEVTANSVPVIRKQHPDAAIIRHLSGSDWLVFDNAEEAIGHPTAQVFKK